MFKKLSLVSIFVAALLGFSMVAKAHSGNTDIYGGHYCYTNCAEYGLSDGEYHLHDDSGNLVPNYTELTAWIPTNIPTIAGAEVRIPIMVNELQYIIRFSFSMIYDPTILTFVENEASLDAPGYVYTSSELDVANNLRELTVTGEGPYIQGSGMGKLVNIVFTSSPTANGITPIDLIDVDEGGLPVVVLDGTVNIDGPDIIPSDINNLTDTVAAVAITKPNSGQDYLTNKDRVTLKGTSSVGNVASVRVNDELTDRDAATGSWEIEIELDEGDNDIEVGAYNSSQIQVATDSMRIELDTEAPKDVKNLEIDGAQLFWDKSKSNDVEKYIIYSMAGGKEKKITTSKKTSATVEGSGPFRVTAIDEAGNESDIDDAPEVSGGIVGVETGFIDVPASHWASGYINLLKNMGIIHGVGNYFFPERYVTRAEYSKMLIGAVGELAATTDTPFMDVRPDYSLANFISRIFKLGWARGEGRYFYPNRPITRMEASWMTIRAARLSESQSANFSDIENPIDKIVAGMMVENGIMNGNNGRFLPNGHLTRAEAAKLVAKVYEKVH